MDYAQRVEIDASRPVGYQLENCSAQLQLRLLNLPRPLFDLSVTGEIDDHCYYRCFLEEQLS